MPQTNLTRELFSTLNIFFLFSGEAKFPFAGDNSSSTPLCVWVGAAQQAPSGIWPRFWPSINAPGVWIPDFPLPEQGKMGGKWEIWIRDTPQMSSKHLSGTSFCIFPYNPGFSFKIISCSDFFWEFCLSLLRIFSVSGHWDPSFHRIPDWFHLEEPWRSSPTHIFPQLHKKMLSWLWWKEDISGFFSNIYPPFMERIPKGTNKI